MYLACATLTEPRGRYEELRANPVHFAVASAEMHVVPEVERVVEKRERYWGVEKLGEAAEVAENSTSVSAS